MQKRLTALERQLKSAKNEKTKRAAEKRAQETRDGIRRLTNRLKQATQPKPTSSNDAMLVMAVSEATNVADTKLRIRGEPDEFGREIPRGFLTIASLEKNPGLSADQSGRLELSDWITRTSNPLTARVMANRVWQHLFGRGIVSTVNNFGANGDRPTHPLLLDHLATSFVSDGWSVKSLIRRIMISRVYRLSSQDDAGGLAADPDNTLLWRMNQRRLEAEAIRDAMLLASGQLDLKPQTGSPVASLGEGIVGRNINTTQLATEHLARSVYLPIVRGAVPEMLSLFDFPEPSIIGGVRNVTTVPTQALFMMNSPQVLRNAGQLARRVRGHSDDDRERVREAYLLTLSRQPTTAEIDRALAFISETENTLTQVENKQADESKTIAWTGFCQSLFASSEFRYVN